MEEVRGPAVSAPSENGHGSRAQLLDALDAALAGDFTVRLPHGGHDPEVVRGFNRLMERNESLTRELERVRTVIGRDGRMTERASLAGAGGSWARSVHAVNDLIDDLVRPTAEVGRVITAVARGDLSQTITADAKGEMLELKNTINTMVDQLSSFADEVTRVAREVGTEGKLGGQARVKGVSGVWKELTDNVNSMASNLTGQVRNIAQVTTAVASGDLSQKITVDAKGEILELKSTINTMVDQLSSFADEVTRVAGEVGTEGKLGGQARVKGVSGVWKELTDNVNQLAANLTTQVRNIAQVTTAVAQGDLSQKITVDVSGEVLELKNTINTMVDQLSSFADEVTRVAREVGTEGKLGGQARVKGVSGVWKELTDNVNSMASNLTGQVRNIAQVTTAVAQGDLSQKITVSAEGEILSLKSTINTMVDQLSSFADEVTRVAREVGTEGELGGQARVKGVSGVWKELTDNVNQLAANLTTQVRAIADVSTAVTRGDLTRSITVQAQGEVAELKDNVNQMIANLRETTRKNAEQDWLKTNVARISTLLQGQRDLLAVANLIMSELTPVVSAQHGAFFLAEGAAVEDAYGQGATDRALRLRLVASYGYRARRNVPAVFSLGEGLVGQSALEKQPILITDAPDDYVKVTSGLGESAPINLIVLPIVVEDEVLGVIELASLAPFKDVHQQFLEELVETIGVVLNTIRANMRTEELLEQSQRLTGELQHQSSELQAQQEELRETNEELQEKAALLAEQKHSVEVKNREIEEARRNLQEKAEQLALSSKYKSEFLANMSHELRTPLNSMMLMAKLLADTPEENLTEEQIEFARTIEASGRDLLDLINEILDLSKIEAGRMEVEPETVQLSDVRSFVEQSFAPVAEDKGLAFGVDVGPDVPTSIVTDERRLQQVLKNLLSNALKFTETGHVDLRVRMVTPRPTLLSPDATETPLVAFAVHDTGIGIPRDKLQLIFEAFQQADGSTNRRFGGTGLGLSISRELARLLGGHIEARSDEGRGSVFTLLLPLDLRESDRPVAPDDPVVPTTEEVPDDTEAPTAEDTPTAEEVLDDTEAPTAADAPTDADTPIVADTDTDADARPLLVISAGHDRLRPRVTAAAQAAGFSVVTAGDRARALTTARREHPAAIVLQLDLPTASGLGLLAELKADPELLEIPIYVLANSEQEEHARRAGAFAVADVDAMSDEDLTADLRGIAAFTGRSRRRVLLVGAGGDDLAAALRGDRLELVTVIDLEAARSRIGDEPVDALVADLRGDDGEREQRAQLLVSAATDLAPLPVVALVDAEPTGTPTMDGRVVTATSVSQLQTHLSRRLHQRVGAARPLVDDSVLDGKRVLLVDDDARNLMALTAALRRHGLQVSVTEHGREALEMLRVAPVDLVLMDIMMPEMDGFATTRAIREKAALADLPIVMLTAKAMPEDREASLAAGASDFITKPVDVEELLSLLRVWLDR